MIMTTDENHSHPKLDVVVNTFKLPHSISGQVELILRNVGSIPINRAALTVQEDPSYDIKAMSPIGTIGADNTRYYALQVTPRSREHIVVRGSIEYSGSDGIPLQMEVSIPLEVTDPEQYPPFHPPYIAGPMVRDARMFFGRRKEIRRIIDILDSADQTPPIVLHGLWRAGKSSILQQICTARPDQLGVEELWRLQHSYYPVIVDMEILLPTTTIWSFYHHMYETIWRVLHDYVPNLAIITDSEFKNADRPDVLFMHFLDELREKLTHQRRKLLLMLDEFHTVLLTVARTDPDVLARLREIASYDNVAVIFVGPIYLVRMMREFAQRLLELCGSQILVGRLEDGDDIRLITAPIQMVCPEFEWSNEATKYIVELTDGYPWYMQSLCQTVIFNLKESRRLRATWNDVDQAASFLNAQRYFDTVFKREIDDSKMIPVISLVAISHVERESGHGIWITLDEIRSAIERFTSKFEMEQIPEALDSLYRDHLIDVNDPESSSRYRIRRHFLYRYLIRAMSLQSELHKAGYPLREASHA